MPRPGEVWTVRYWDDTEESVIVLLTDSQKDLVVYECLDGYSYRASLRVFNTEAVCKHLTN
jgi:hypothetical protein